MIHVHTCVCVCVCVCMCVCSAVQDLQLDGNTRSMVHERCVPVK